MGDAQTSEDVSTKRLKVAERAKREPEARLLALARLIDEEMLMEAFERIRNDAAVGVDGINRGRRPGTRGRYELFRLSGRPMFLRCEESESKARTVPQSVCEFIVESAVLAAADCADDADRSRHARLE
jgi:hypothetical protein